MSNPPSYRLGRAVTALAIATTLLGSTAPSPLYPIYTERLGLAHAQATLIFAIYAIGTLVSLLLSAWLSRRIYDLRAILVAGLVVTALGALMFGLAENLTMLLIGRFLNGLGTGAITGMGSAALISLSAPHRKHIGATIATVAFTGGAAGGPLLSALALWLDLAPTLSPFLVIAGLSVGGLLGFKLAAWPDARGKEHPAREPEKGKTHIGLYLLACLGIVAAWSIASAFMAVGSDLAIEVYGFTSMSTAGLLIALFQLFAGLGQASFGRRRSFTPMLYGFSGIALVLIFLVIMAGQGHPVALAFAMPVFGLSYGAVFVQALALVGASAAPQRSAALIAGFYFSGYLANALPTITLGALTDQMGLTSAFKAFSLVVASLALIGAGFALDARRRHSIA